MDNNMVGTIAFLQSLCTTPEQQQMLQWMQSQPRDQLTQFLKTAMVGIPRDGLAAMVQQHMANHPPEVQQQVLGQVVQAYDFLNAS